MVSRGFPRLPDADPWDAQTGSNVASEFWVSCDYAVLDSKWARMQPFLLMYHDVPLGKPVEVLRPERSPELLALAWTKRSLMGAGLCDVSMEERNPGHTLEKSPSGVMFTCTFRWKAIVRTRVGVAAVRLDPEQGGYVRLIPID